MDPDSWRRERRSDGHRPAAAARAARACSPSLSGSGVDARRRVRPEDLGTGLAAASTGAAPDERGPRRNRGSNLLPRRGRKRGPALTRMPSGRHAARRRAAAHRRGACLGGRRGGGQAPTRRTEPRGAPGVSRAYLAADGGSSTETEARRGGGRTASPRLAGRGPVTLGSKEKKTAAYMVARKIRH